MRYLLAQADRQIEAKYATESLAEEAFIESFLTGLLFYGQAVLSDIYCFISNSLSRALWKQERSHSIAPLFRLALAKGLLVPAFRSADSTFLGNYKLIETQRIQGLQRTAEATANQLDSWFSTNSSPEIIRWPADISVRYGEVLRDTLFADHLEAEETLSASRLAELATLRRYLSTKNATPLLFGSSSVPNHGLRRGDVYNWLYSQELGDLPRRPGRESFGVDDVSQILDHPKCLADPALHATLRRLLELIDYLYAFNKAKALNVDVYFTGLDELSRLFSWNAAQRAFEMSPKGGSESDTTGVFSCTVRIPSIRHLLAVSPEDLISIRCDAGEAYFTLLKMWHADPARYEEDLQRSLVSYASDLSSRVRESTPVVDVMLNKVRYSDRARLRELSPLLDGLLKPPDPASRVLLSALRPLSNILYSWASERDVTVHHDSNSQASPGYVL